MALRRRRRGNKHNPWTAHDRQVTLASAERAEAVQTWLARHHQRHRRCGAAAGISSQSRGSGRHPEPGLEQMPLLVLACREGHLLVAKHLHEQDKKTWEKQDLEPATGLLRSFLPEALSALRWNLRTTPSRTSRTSRGRERAAAVDQKNAEPEGGGDDMEGQERGGELEFPAPESMPEPAAPPESAIRKPGPCGNTPLHEACRAGHARLAQWLLWQGAYPDLGIRNAAGQTPRHLAACRGDQRLDALLQGFEAWVQGKRKAPPRYLADPAGSLAYLATGTGHLLPMSRLYEKCIVRTSQEGTAGNRRRVGDRIDALAGTSAHGLDEPDGHAGNNRDYVGRTEAEARSLVPRLDLRRVQPELKKSQQCTPPGGSIRDE